MKGLADTSSAIKEAFRGGKCNAFPCNSPLPHVLNTGNIFTSSRISMLMYLLPKNKEETKVNEKEKHTDEACNTHAGVGDAVLQLSTVLGASSLDARKLDKPDRVVEVGGVHISP